MGKLKALQTMVSRADGLCFASDSSISIARDMPNSLPSQPTNPTSQIYNPEVTLLTIKGYDFTLSETLMAASVILQLATFITVIIISVKMKK